MKKINTYLGALVFCLALANIIVSARVSNTGDTLRNLENQAREMKHENQLLEQQVVSTRSLTTLSAKAADLGFTAKPGILTLPTDEAVAEAIIP